jgi:hypothetical protein
MEVVEMKEVVRKGLRGFPAVRTDFDGLEACRGQFLRIFRPGGC